EGARATDCSAHVDIKARRRRRSVRGATSAMLPRHELMDLFSLSNPTTPEISTLSLHDALPIFSRSHRCYRRFSQQLLHCYFFRRSEEHTSELQSPYELVCRLLLEKKNNNVRSEDAIKYAFPTS